MARFLREKLERVKNFMEPEPIDGSIQEVTIKQNWRFSDFKEVIDKLNLICRSPIYETEPKSRLQRYHDIVFLFKANIPLALMEFIYFIFFTKQNLLVFISTSFQIAGFLTTFIVYLNLVYFKQDYTILLNWVGALPGRSCYIMENTGWTPFYKAKRGSLLLIKFTFVGLILTAISLNIIYPLFRYFINGELYALPIFIHLPFLRAVNLPFYLINLAHQIYVVICALVWTFTFVSIAYTILIHACVHLEAIKTLIGDMANTITKRGFENWLKLISMELIDVKVNLKLLCHRVLPVVFYLAEKMVYFSFILFWLTAIKVERRLLSWAITSGMLLLLAFLFVIFSEVLLDQFDGLSDLFYEQPWYELTPADRRLLLPTMIQLQFKMSPCFGTRP